MHIKATPRRVARRLARRLTLLAIPAALAACGGGSDSSNDVQPPAPAALAIAGTAATGAAMANAAITVTCATGSTTTTSGTDGTFKISITGGALPCVLTATSSDKSLELHSVVPGTSTGSASATANITPLSELLIAKYAGTDPKAFVTAFTASTVIKPADVTTAQTALLNTLKTAGVDTTKASDILAGSIVAGSKTDYDGVLEQLKSTLSGAGATLTDLTAAVQSTSKSSDVTTGATLTTVLAPAASDCPGLKTGKLRVVNFETTDPALASYVVSVDAAALTATVGSTKYTLAKNAACDYTASATGATATRVLVARSGLAVLLQSGGVAGVAIPDQQLDVAALAGSYNRVSFSKTFDTFIGDFGVTKFRADGYNGPADGSDRGIFNCPQGYGQCTEDVQKKGTLKPNTAGGFDYVDPNDPQSTRVFAFRNAAGRVFMLGWEPATGLVHVLASQDKLALPAVGKASSFWQFTVRPATGISAVTEDSNTVTKVDSTAGTVTRQFSTSTNDGHFDTLAFNPVDATQLSFAGARYRDPALCTDAQGAAYTKCSRVVSLPFEGVVVTVSTVNSNRFLSVSIDKP